MTCPVRIALRHGPSWIACWINSTRAASSSLQAIAEGSPPTSRTIPHDAPPPPCWPTASIASSVSNSLMPRDSIAIDSSVISPRPSDEVGRMINSLAKYLPSRDVSPRPDYAWCGPLAHDLPVIGRNLPKSRCHQGASSGLGQDSCPVTSVVAENHNVRLVKRMDFWHFDPICLNQRELAAAGSISYAGDQFLQTMDRTSSLYDGHHIGLGSQARFSWLPLKAK